MITGGEAPNYPVSHRSTEILLPGTSSWKAVGDLPVGVRLVRGISLNNEIIVSGEFDFLIMIIFLLIMIFKEDN